MRVSCFGHNLDLAINKGLNAPRIDRVIGLCRKVRSVILLVQLEETEGIKRGSMTKGFIREEVEKGCSHKIGTKGGNDAKNIGTAGCYPHGIGQR